MKLKDKENQIKDLGFGLKVITLISFLSLILAFAVLYFINDYRYVAFDLYSSSDVKAIRKRMVKDKYFYKYLIYSDRPSEVDDSAIDKLAVNTVLIMKSIDSLNIQKIDEKIFDKLSSKKPGLFKSGKINFYISEDKFLKYLKELYGLELESFDIEKYPEFQKIGVSYNGNIYVSFTENELYQDKYVMGVESIKKTDKYFVMDCYLYGYDYNIDEDVLKDLKDQIKSGNFDYINEEFIMSNPISILKRTVKFKETPFGLNFKYNIIESENIEMN